MALIIIAGMFVTVHIKKSLFPEITFPQIKIIAENGLQPVGKMKVTVTRPLEEAIKKVPGLHDLRSITSRGSCEVSAFMCWGENIDLAKQRIEGQISQMKNTLPPDVQITVKKMDPSILPVMGYALESKTESPVALRQLALYTVKPFLSQVAGVANVAVSGGKTKEFWIELNQQEMDALSITPAMIRQALSQTGFTRSNGYLPDYRRLYLTVTDATVHTIRQIGNIVIRNNGGRAIRVKDIAAVTIHPGIDYVRINANGRPAVLIAVIKNPGANLLDVSKDVEQKLVELKRTLPKDVKISPYYIQADFVHDAIRSVSDALWIGVLLAIVVAIVFLRSVKASAVILITVPVTLLFTLMIMYAVGYTLNIMTIGALAAAIALIVDDAIVVVEQLHRTQEEHPAEPAFSLVPKTIRYLFPAMVVSSLSTIIIFIPFDFMDGMAGSYFKVLANTMIITLSCSFVVSWLGLPVLYLLFSKNDSKCIRQKYYTLHIRQRHWVRVFIKRPLISVIFIAGLVVGIILVIPKLETGFLPEMDEGSIVLDYATPPGTSLDETDRICRQIEKIIMSEPDVAGYSRRTGTQMGFFITEPNTGDYLIALKKDRGHSTFEVINDIRRQIEASQPAVRVDFGQVIGDMLGDLSTSVQPIEIKIFGNNRQTLNKLAMEVAAVADSVKGAADVFNGIIMAGPSIRIKPLEPVLKQYGMNPADLQYQLQTALEGNVVGSVLDPEQQTAIRMIYPGNYQRGIDAIGHGSVFLPNGHLIPAKRLIDVSIESGDAEIQRENLQSMSIVTARLSNRSLGSVVRDIRKAVEDKVFLPGGYHIEYGGQYTEQQNSFRQLLVILVTVGLLVFCLMLFFTRDFVNSIIILLIALLGVGGSLLALFITHTPLNVSSYAGMIMIVGIIGENAVFTFLQFNECLKTGGVVDSLVYAISTRLRPKLMTALGAIMALLPLALGIGAGAQLHQPLAVAVIGGLVVALPLLLVAMPSLLRIRYKFCRPAGKI
ncbi:MAG TPA: efflux RND transporter permease subunit [Edaphocola sp.]|nr:efflux RND transporter permease subunit [Edaphocola sp.]